MSVTHSASHLPDARPCLAVQAPLIPLHHQVVLEVGPGGDLVEALLFRLYSCAVPRPHSRTKPPHHDNEDRQGGDPPLVQHEPHQQQSPHNLREGAHGYFPLMGLVARTPERTRPSWTGGVDRTSSPTPAATQATLGPRTPLPAYQPSAVSAQQRVVPHIPGIFWLGVL
jgi:hypothetical protein